MQKFKLMGVACLPAILSLCACRPDLRPEGRYSGTLYQPVDGALQAKSVVFTIDYDAKGAGALSIVDLESKPVRQFQLVIRTANDIGVESHVLRRNSDDTSSMEFGNCFSDTTMKLCYDEASFSIETFELGASPGVDTLGLFGQLSLGVSPPAMETPRSFTLEEALGTALQRNFGSRIEYEHAIQARLSAKSAYLQLLPHLSASSALMALGGGVTGVLAALGDFAPFLFPSRWLQAKEARKRSFAEQDVLALMRADLMPQVEGLVYTSLQDEASLVLYQETITDTEAVYQSVSNLESQGQMPAGSADHLLSSLQSLQLDEQGLKVLVDKDHSAIAQALGFINPNAITGVSLPLEASPVETAQPVQFENLVGTVLDRSLELRQIADLTVVARLQKNELPYDWLDPAYDSSQDPGFQLGAEVGVSESKLQELRLISQQMVQTLELNFNDAIEDYSLAREQFPKATAHFELQKRRWARVIAQVFPGTTLNTMDVQSVLGDYLAGGLDLETIRASFRVARARVDRLLLQNSYAAPELHRINP